MFIENLYYYYPSPYQYNNKLLPKKIQMFYIFKKMLTLSRSPHPLNFLMQKKIGWFDLKWPGRVIGIVHQEKATLIHAKLCTLFIGSFSLISAIECIYCLLFYIHFRCYTLVKPGSLWNVLKGLPAFMDCLPLFSWSNLAYMCTKVA